MVRYINFMITIKSRIIGNTSTGLDVLLAVEYLLHHQILRENLR
jgi:hypothetical protein